MQNAKKYKCFADDIVDFILGVFYNQIANKIF